MQATHVIFDMDGLLLDTETIYTKVSSEILERYNLKYTWELKAQLMGKKELDAAEFLVKATGLPLTPQEYLSERNKKQNELFMQCNPLPGVEKLVKHLKKHNIPMAVCTSSHSRAYDIKTTNSRHLFSLFDAVVCGDDPRLLRGKPHPDIFELGLKLINGSSPSRALVFEDSPAGVRAGIAANMQVVWVPDPNLEIEQELLNQCSLKLSSLELFDPSHFGLPPYEQM